MESSFTHGEAHLEIERSRNYKGTAKINLEEIGFPDSLQSVEQHIVDRLCESFQKEGCHRLDAQNHVTAIISLQDLREALQAAGKSLNDLLTSDSNHLPHLRFLTGQVLCLHGRHRIRAAAKVLASGDRWWTVDIYLENISHELQTAFTEGYFDEEQASDGEIYRKIRRYQQEHNAFFQKMWWARLTDDKARYLRQISNNIDLCSAFDALLSIPGLWGGMSLEDVAKMMELNCDEEIVHYLTSHLRGFWISLVSSDPTNPDLKAMMKIDTHTVEKLELMAPKASYRDARKVQRLLCSGEVLSKFSLSERLRMWKWLRDYDGIIPSLRTFFRDIEYLKECGNTVKSLVSLSKNGSTARRYCYNSRNPMDEGRLIPTSGDTFERQFGSREVQQELSYRQIWLYVLRYYPRIPRLDPMHTNRVTVSGTTSTWYVRRNVYFAFFGRLDDLLTIPPKYNAVGMPSCIAHEGSAIGAPSVGFRDPMPGDAERGTEIANLASEKEADEKAVAGIEVVDQSQLPRDDEYPVVEQKHFQGEAEENAVEGTEPGNAPLEENGLKAAESPKSGLLELDRRGCSQPVTREPSNSPSPSLQLKNELSDFIAKLCVSISPREDDLQQSGQHRSHIIDQANNVRKRRNINDDDSDANKKLNSGSKLKRSRTRTMAETHSSSLNEAESIRLDLLRTLMKKAGQSFKTATLRKIYQMGDRIIHDTNVVLSSWNEWLSRECQAPRVVLPAYHNLSSAEICFAAYRLLASTHKTFHHGSVHRRLAQVLLHIFVHEFDKELQEREDKQEVVLQRDGRSVLTIVHDLIVEQVGEFEKNSKKWNRLDVVEDKNLGKRWWRLGSGIGFIAILTCAPDLATSHVNKGRGASFSNAKLDLLVNYMRNAYPTAVAHLQSLDPVIQRLIVSVSLPTDNDIVRPYPPSFLRFETLPEDIQWTKTESAMGVATEKLLRSLGRMK